MGSVPAMSRRRLAVLGAVATALLGAVVVVAAERVDDHQTRTGIDAGAAPTIVMVDPPLFSKQILLGPGRGTTTATTSSSITPTATAPSTAPAPPTPAPDGTKAPPPAAESAPAPGGTRCVVRLHGKGGGAAGTHAASGGVVEVAPGGNAPAWGGLVWQYFPDSGYGGARNNVVSAADAAGCGRIIVVGFSNGASFAAKLYCRGETFGGRLVGVVVDDPVVDHAVEGCHPASGVRVALYWTGALAATATPGWNCAEQDWTCEGGTTVGIDAYQSALGVGHKQSPHTSHAPYSSPPELGSWW
jgi:hypothetical protein